MTEHQCKLHDMQFDSEKNFRLFDVDQGFLYGHWSCNAFIELFYSLLIAKVAVTSRHREEEIEMVIWRIKHSLLMQF